MDAYEYEQADRSALERYERLKEYDPQTDPLMGPCRRCGDTYEQHPGGFCRDGIDTSGTVEIGTAPEYVPADEPLPGEATPDAGL